jgi:transposase-like protein
MDSPFGDNLFEQFMIYDQFFATEVPCPWCSQRFQLDIQTGETDDRYECSHCHRVFSVDWETREVRRVETTS